jgi:2-polyprenyl-6-hydroxyphenyl methylase / 3-demethylubiquinone-9 3-methyltransferase
MGTEDRGRAGCRMGSGYPYSIHKPLSKTGAETLPLMSADPLATRPHDSVDPEQVARFAALAEAWWDLDGKFRPLHRINPVRLAFIRDRICARFGHDPQGSRPLEGQSIADIGCGGGLLSEPLARLGARVTAVDAAPENIAAARRHAAEGALGIDYREGTAEMLADAGEKFDAVLAMEIIEHVADVQRFAAATAALVDEGGLLVLSTLNRTVKSFAFAIIGAEYVLGWLPPGTHDWHRFLRPSELAKAFRTQGLRLGQATGVVYSPIADKWQLDARDLDINYLLCLERA